MALTNNPGRAMPYEIFLSFVPALPRAGLVTHLPQYLVRPSAQLSIVSETSRVSYNVRINHQTKSQVRHCDEAHAREERLVIILAKATILEIFRAGPTRLTFGCFISAITGTKAEVAALKVLRQMRQAFVRSETLMFRPLTMRLSVCLLSVSRK
jgi:hypothetical protein